MNSYKNSWERKRRVSKLYKEIPTYQHNNDLQRDKPIRNQEWITSPAYRAARQKAIKEKVYAYIIIGCAVAVCGILLMWP